MSPRRIPPSCRSSGTWRGRRDTGEGLRLEAGRAGRVLRGLGGAATDAPQLTPQHHHLTLPTPVLGRLLNFLGATPGSPSWGAASANVTLPIGPPPPHFFDLTSRRPQLRGGDDGDACAPPLTPLSFLNFFWPLPPDLGVGREGGGGGSCQTQKQMSYSRGLTISHPPLPHKHLYWPLCLFPSR